MSCIAILVGNSEYKNLQHLQCCRDDVLAIKELLEATGKYDEITLIENADADALKSDIRSAIDKVQSPNELFFYFTGHGYQHETEFFFCAANFDLRRPNATGLSTTELHTLLRLADASLVVKVVDACNSGTLLIKSDGGWISQSKEGFRNLIQFASCLDSQSSLTGDPLSLFTDKFRAAAIRKTDGIVFYTDIVTALRDEFIDNNSQTPFFVSQHTGREQFVDDAKKMDDLRRRLVKPDVATAGGVPAILDAVRPPATLLQRLVAVDARAVTADKMDKFVASLFDDLVNRVSSGEFAEFFELDVTEHSYFAEDAVERFIIRVLSNEKRMDNFVTAVHSRKPRQRNPLFGGSLLGEPYFDNDMFEESWNLSLNCTMARAQVRITFTPKFMTLQRIVLVVTCAPSLDNCYIFEVATQHMLRDFAKYDNNGMEVSRRWWKMSWEQATAAVAKQIALKLIEIVQGQLEMAERQATPPVAPDKKTNT